MWHTIAFVADSRHLDVKALEAFALADADKYGIATDRGEPQVNTWHADKLVADFKATISQASAPQCPKCGGEMVPGHALRGAPRGVTYEGEWPTKMVECLKCKTCGYSEE